MRVQRVVLDQNSVNQSVRAERIAVTVGRKRKYTTKAAAWGADGVALIDDVLVLRCTLYAERSDMSTFLPKPLKVKVHGEGRRKKKSGQVRFEDLDVSQGVDDTPWAQKQTVRLTPVKGTTDETAFLEVSVSCTVLADANSDDEDDGEDEDRGSDTDNDEDDDGEGEEFGESTSEQRVTDTTASASEVGDRDRNGHRHLNAYRDTHNEQSGESGHDDRQVIGNTVESGALRAGAPARKSSGAQQSIAPLPHTVQQPVVSLCLVKPADQTATESNSAREQARGQTPAQAAATQASLREHVSDALILARQELELGAQRGGPPLQLLDLAIRALHCPPQ